LFDKTENIRVEKITSIRIIDYKILEYTHMSMHTKIICKKV